MFYTVNFQHNKLKRVPTILSSEISFCWRWF